MYTLLFYVSPNVLQAYYIASENTEGEPNTAAFLKTVIVKHMRKLVGEIGQDEEDSNSQSPPKPIAIVADNARVFMFSETF